MSIKNGADKESESEGKMTCGIIMPIAGSSEYSADHWKDVLAIISDSIEATGSFTPQLVSDDVAVGLIHERIVNNIYSNEVVVCDVSSKNPNVMFELGMRLAFDKPTIIIKDLDTGYSFDTGVVEHLNYPKSLRFADIVAFKASLAARINATYKASQSEPEFSPFLKSFGKTIKPAKLKQTEISQAEFIVSQINALSKEVNLLRREGYLSKNHARNRAPFPIELVENKLKEAMNKNPGQSIHWYMSEVGWQLREYQLSELELSSIFDLILGRKNSELNIG